MPRRKAAIKREVLPDPKYHSELVERLVNVIMREGKKSIAQKIVYQSLESLSHRVKKEHKSDDDSDSGKSSSAGKSSVRAKKSDVAQVSHTDAQHDESLDMLRKSLDNIAPPVEVKSRRVGGATYQVPVEVPKDRGFALAMRWVVDAAKGRSEKTMADKLSAELYDAYHNRGASIKKRQDVMRMAEANKAFAHYRW